MKKHMIILATLLLALSTQQAIAHGDHGLHHPIDGAAAIVIANKVTTELTQYDPGLGFGQLNKTWGSIAAESIKVHEKGDGYYIVSVNNSKENKTLYILMSNVGRVYDANLTGHFPKLKKQ